MTRATRRVKLQARTTQVHMEWVHDAHVWRMWISFDPAMTNGTFIEMHEDGKLFRVTVNLDGTEERHAVTLAETVV